MIFKFPKLRIGVYFFALLMACTLRGEALFQPIFDGETLDGWDGDLRFWRVEDGVIIGETTPSNRTNQNTFLIRQGGELEDFELKVDFYLRNHNSGIQYRSFRLEDSDQEWRVGGYQADIAEDTQWMGAVYGEAYKGIIAKRGEKVVLGESGAERRVVALLGDSDEILGKINLGGWNEYHIIARGNQCIQRINGVTTAEFSEASASRLKRGLLALQLHAGPPMEVQFRNIRLRELKPEDKKEVLFLAGKDSHNRGAHEHRAGSELLARCLNESSVDVIAQVATEGQWPMPWIGYGKPSAVVMYCDGYAGHMAKQHQAQLQALVDAGVGVACLHFAVEVEKDTLGPHFFEWIGGFFEAGWSVNPFWTPEFTALPEHPITRGVKPFSIRDEWYYHMRFQPEMSGITPILAAVPPLRTLTSRSKDTLRGSNPTVFAEVSDGVKQITAWAYLRPDGGRGFGFTGGHMHTNWQQPDFRKLVLNAILWTAQVDVPADGVQSRELSERDMELNLSDR